jgi:hypothetical protein
MPMDNNVLPASLIVFLESNPALFVRCDHDGKDNLVGEFWRAREKISAGPWLNHIENL